MSLSLHAFDPVSFAIFCVSILVFFWVAFAAFGFRYIPNSMVGVVEKLWSQKGSITDGHIIAQYGEAGFQADLLRGGIHLWLWPWQYRIHKAPLVTIAQGKIGYVYARDGEMLPPGQTLAQVVECNNYQNARAFLGEMATDTSTSSVGHGCGQRGRQRALLREGVYAINLSLFVVIAEDEVYSLASNSNEFNMISTWQKELLQSGGFAPVVIGNMNNDGRDDIGVVTVQDGMSLGTGEIIAPAVGTDRNDANFHNNFQDPEAFLRAGGRRGKQYYTLTDGTYFINRWFATVEHLPKTIVPIGFVGVVASYYGPMGRDVSGESFRHGERVATGEKGVWAEPLGPGKYAFNTYAGQVLLVPTTNFVLHWITGKTEASHKYDENLKSIDLVTKDAYEPMLPLSLVVHIDYKKAPGVIQRFGDVKKLITQTIDPMLSAFFRDIAHKRTMLELLQNRDSIQKEAQAALRDRFREFDIECVDVLIGKPETDQADGKIESLLEQLRQRQLSKEQIETFAHQRAAAEELKKFAEAKAIAEKQKELTDSSIAIKIAENAGNADLARAEMQAKQTIVVANAALERSKREAETTIINANAEGQKTVIAARAVSEREILVGKGEATKALQVGLAESTVLARKVSSYGDPKYFALIQTSSNLAQSKQPLVPERMFVSGASGEGAASPLNTLLEVLLAGSTTFSSIHTDENPIIKEFSDRLVTQAAEAMVRSKDESKPN